MNDEVRIGSANSCFPFDHQISLSEPLQILLNGIVVALVAELDCPDDRSTLRRSGPCTRITQN